MKPTWKLQSNLGPQLATGLKHALREEMDLRGRQLVAKLDGYMREQSAKLDRLVKEKSRELIGKFNLSHEEIVMLARQLTDRFWSGIGFQSELKILTTTES